MNDAAVLRFGRFELQARERRLLVDGVPAPIGARAFDVLACLASRPDRLVTKQELLETVWAGLVVEEGNLTVQVSTLRKLLGGEVIATIPGRGYRFTAAVAPGAAEPPAVTPGPAAASAPASAPPALFGRDADLARATAALAEAVCVTLTGVAGVGKTSLARAVAAGRPQGCVWLDLVPVADGERWTPALARALGVPPDAADAASLARAIGARLLVVDNAEHLVAATAAQVAALLAAGPALRVLVTSQTPLAIRAERVLTLAPLASDDDGAPGAAVELFLARVAATGRRLGGDGAERALAREICRRLDGLPLALEMAAARVPALGLRGVHDALADRLALLKSGYRDADARHRTLRAALDWSHSLLSDDERRLYRALAVFAGGFTLELAVAVAADAGHDRWAVVDALTALVDRSLVAVDGGETPRLRLLETMRAHALERLAEAGDGDRFRRRHAEALLALVRERLAAAPAALQALAAAEHDNARDALAWATAHDPALAVALGRAVAIAAAFSSWRAEAAQWLEATAHLVDDASVEPAARADWWAERARQLLFGGHPGARDAAAQARQRHAALGHDRGVFDATIALVRASTAPDAALPALCDELQALLDRHPEWPTPRMQLMLVGTRAVVCSLLGDHAASLRHRLDELELARACGLPNAADAAETNIAAALLRLGRADEALQRATALLARIGERESINSAYGWRYRVDALLALDRLDEARAATPRLVAVHRGCALPLPREAQALLLAREGRLADAARMAGHARALRRRSAIAPDADQIAQLARAEAAVGEAFGDAAAGYAAEGAALDDDAADRLFAAAP